MSDPHDSQPQDPTAAGSADLTEDELDALWSVYEGHSLLIERPQKEGAAPNVNVILSVEYEDDAALAEVEELEEDLVDALIAKGYLERSLDGPVLDEDSWFDDELDCEVRAEEYVLSQRGSEAIDSTSEEGFAEALEGHFEDDEELDDDGGAGEDADEA